MAACRSRYSGGFLLNSCARPCCWRSYRPPASSPTPDVNQDRKKANMINSALNLHHLSPPSPPNTTTISPPHSGTSNPFCETSTNLFPTNLASVAPRTAFLTNICPPVGAQISLPNRPSSASNTASHTPGSPILSLDTFAVRSPIRHTSSIVPINSSISSSAVSSDRQENAVPHALQKPRQTPGEEENSLKGAAAAARLPSDEGFVQRSWEGLMVMRWAMRAPLCFRHCVHWQMWDYSVCVFPC